MKPKPLSEAHIQNTCTQLLELDGWRALRTDPVSRREWGKGFGELGMADHLYIRYRKTVPDTDLRHDGFYSHDVEMFWIEWKRLKSPKAGCLKAKATKASQRQLDWHRDERARGALTLIAGMDFPASIEGFLAWYNQSGLARRRLTLARSGGIAYLDSIAVAELGRIVSESTAKLKTGA